MMHQKEVLISVIVPVYNVERYLPECLESILKQDIAHMEIIVVDDGSTDSSGTICKLYAEQDNRIRVIHQKNAGVSAARNVGLELAQGKYIAFVDSDDVLPEKVYDFLKESHKENILVMGQIQLMSEQGSLMKSNECEACIITKDEFVKDLFAEKRFPYLGYMGAKVFQRDIIEKNNIRFEQDIKVSEDRLFVLEYVLHCDYVNISNKVVYYYRQRSESVVSASRNNRMVTDSEMTVLKSFDKMKKLCKDYSEEVYYLCARKAFESALDLLNRVSDEEMKKKHVLRIFLWDNCKLCLQNPDYLFWDKLKIMVHSILQR